MQTVDSTSIFIKQFPKIRSLVLLIALVNHVVVNVKIKFSLVCGWFVMTKRQK